MGFNMKVSANQLYQARIIDQETKQEIDSYPVKFSLKKKKDEIIGKAQLTQSYGKIDKEAAIKVVKSKKGTKVKIDSKIKKQGKKSKEDKEDLRFAVKIVENMVKNKDLLKQLEEKSKKK